MKRILDLIAGEAAKAFAAAGYDASYAKVTLSNRPDLCEYQCNGALAAAKAYKKAPIMIAKDCLPYLQESSMFSSVEAVPPGFINIKLDNAFLASYLQQMAADAKFGLNPVDPPQKIIVDYGGPNVAKPLHVGHLRSAVIGESVKRIARYMGNEVIGDVHLGDWGLQMGLIITELKHRSPELVYFDDTFTGAYPKEAPFTISDLEEIYPAASAYSKEHPEYKEEALEATHRLQDGDRGYRALWEQILAVSIADIRKNYERLQVSFELWKKESDAHPYIADMVAGLKESGLAYTDQGALIVDVSEEADTKEIPPCIILKSDASALYSTTDLATLVDRMQNMHPDKVIYLADKRQDLHFTQVFRCARKAGIVDADTGLTFLGFGTVNGKDGKPYKTREGGIMRLERLLDEINEEMYHKIVDNHEVPEEEARQTAQIVGLAAIKYGDLSNQASKDYVFDVDRFTSFEGNTGPYILYTIVRIKSILKKYEAQMADGMQYTAAQMAGKLQAAASENEKALMLVLSQFAENIEAAYQENAPHKVCAYIYELSNAFNRFYHGTKIMGETDTAKQKSWIALLCLTKEILETCIDLLGFTAPDRM